VDEKALAVGQITSGRHQRRIGPRPLENEVPKAVLQELITRVTGAAKPARGFRAVELLHNSKGAVLRHRFSEQGSPLRTAREQRVGPPLMAQFVGDERGVDGILGRLHKASRTPVREALARLAQDGYVEHVAQRGQFVAPVTREVIRDHFELRRLLEGSAAALVARNRDGAQLETLKRAALDLNSDQAAEMLPDGAFGFHAALAAATGNRVWIHLLANCLGQIYRGLTFGLSVAHLRARDRVDHPAIVEAIERRDAEKARARMEHHIDRTLDAVLSASWSPGGR
jgi:DNA-binding GntR family transcriptional regulator